MVLPPVVMGYALLVMFGNQGPLGRWLHDTLGITLAFRWTGAARRHRRGAGRFR